MCTSPQRLTTLLKETRAARAQGVRSASLYGWHSCRMYFVVTAKAKNAAILALSSKPMLPDN